MSSNSAITFTSTTESWRPALRWVFGAALECAVLSLIEGAPVWIKIATIIMAALGLLTLQFEKPIRRLHRRLFAAVLIGLTLLYTASVIYGLNSAANRNAISGLLVERWKAGAGVVVMLVLIAVALRVARGKRPNIVYDHIDEPLNSGDANLYTHLWFRNQPDGRAARDVAARIAWWNAAASLEMFTVDAKWKEIPYDLGHAIHVVNKVDLLPNNASHGLDLVIRKPGDADCYALHAESSFRNTFAPQYRVPAGDYKVKVTLSCEGHAQDFWFYLRNHGSPPVGVNPAPGSP